jgi:hypothetical protein
LEIGEFEFEQATSDPKFEVLNTLREHFDKYKVFKHSLLWSAVVLQLLEQVTNYPKFEGLN